MILIPAYEPNFILVSLITRIRTLLQSSGQENCSLVVIDDGSRSNIAKQVFATLQKDGTRVIHHDSNLGKGAALKTGIDYAIKKGADWVVTADADGQHLPEDIVKVIEAGCEEKDSFILGVREFDADTPLRSRFGNTITRYIFGLIHGGAIKDTQTGLRFIPRSGFAQLENIPYSRYEYEFAALIHMVKLDNVKQIPISTVYEPGNPSSHFRKVIDSARIYYVFVRSLVASLFITGIDVSVFLFALQVFDNTLVSILTSRSIATLIYFYLARKFVFRSKAGAVRQFIQYTLLVVINAFMLSPLIDWLYEIWGTGKGITYVLGSMALYLFNLAVQRWFIFYEKDDRLG